MSHDEVSMPQDCVRPAAISVAIACYKTGWHCRWKFFSVEAQRVQGDSTLRQNASQAQRTITMPQRPSRLDPSSDRGRITNQGAQATLMVCYPREMQASFL